MYFSHVNFHLWAKQKQCLTSTSDHLSPSRCCSRMINTAPLFSFHTSLHIFPPRDRYRPGCPGKLCALQSDSTEIDFSWSCLPHSSPSLRNFDHFHHLCFPSFFFCCCLFWLQHNNCSLSLLVSAFYVAACAFDLSARRGVAG